MRVRLKAPAFFSRYNNLRIRTRLFLLVGLAVVGLGGICGAYVYGDRVVTAAEARLAQYERISALGGTIQLKALEMRRHEKDFLLHKQPRLVALYFKAAADVDKSLAELSAAEGSAPIADSIAALRKGLEGHRTSFEELVRENEQLGYTPDDGLQGLLVLSGQVLDARVSESQRPEIASKVRAMQIAERDFMLRGNDMPLSDFKRHAEEAKEMLAQSSLPDDARASVSDAIDGYISSMKTFTDSFIRAQKLKESMANIFNSIDPIFLKVEDFTRAGAEEAQTEAQAARNSIRTIIIGASVVIILIFSLAGITMARAIVKPIVSMTACMARLAQKDWDAEIPALDRKDEVGQMARAVDVFKQNGIENQRLIAEQKADEEQKALRQRAIEGHIMRFDEVARGVLETVSAASTELQATARSMQATAEETQRQATAVAAASEEATTNVQTVATASEELAASIQEISRQVSKSLNIATQAVGEAERTNTQIKGLADAAQKIGDVVQLINDIASQTNLLALNATIEAARAGDAGKGFAVVASEVKSLATQTAKATEDISAKIAEIQAATHNSVEAIGSIGGTIMRINEIATTIASAVEQQGAATAEIANNAQQVSHGTREVSSNIVNVTQAAGETGSASAQVLFSASELAKQSKSLRRQVDGFLTDIRAA